MPGKSLLVHIVFGVVGFSLFLQGLTMKPLLAKLGLLNAATVHEDYEHARARVVTTNAALERLEDLKKEGLLSADAHQRLRDLYEARRSAAKADAAQHAGDSDNDEQLVEGLRRLAAVERETVRRLVHEGIVTEVVAESLDQAIVARLMNLERSETEGEQGIEAFFEGMAHEETENRHPTGDKEGRAPASKGEGEEEE
jgi:CPA1 family monovalent cation:H+ antiporter